jgi:hypothetical protein
MTMSLENALSWGEPRTFNSGHVFLGDAMNSFVRLAIDAHGRLNRESLSTDFDQGSVIGAAGASRHCKDMCALLMVSGAI